MNKSIFSRLALLSVLLLLLPAPALAGQAPNTVDEIITHSSRGDWHRPDSENILYIQLPSGRVVVELAPDCAPKNIANVKALARSHFYDGMPIHRVQDNRVVDCSWPPNVESRVLAQKMKRTKYAIPAEFERVEDPGPKFTALPDGDVYAPEVGFYSGFPAARDPKTGKMWLINTYGMVGCGRDNDTNSGGGFELYIVIGQPREWDRNYTLIGRVVSGIEKLSSLPRGKGTAGEYESKRLWVRIKTIQVASDVPHDKRTDFEVLRTDSKILQELVEFQRNRPGFPVPAGRVAIGNIPVPVRPVCGVLSH